MSISRAGDMAVLFGPQNITHTWGMRMLARIPMAGGSRRDVLSGVVDADWIPEPTRSPLSVTPAAIVPGP